MINLGRVANNILVLGILFGFFYLIYAGMKSKGATGGLERLKSMFKKNG